MNHSFNKYILTKNIVIAELPQATIIDNKKEYPSFNIKGKIRKSGIVAKPKYKISVLNFAILNTSLLSM